MPVSQLEERRLLSAAIQALVVPSLATEGETVEVSAEATAVGSLQFDWTVTRDTTVIAEASTRDFTFQPSEEGAYTVSLTVTDSADQGAATATAQLEVRPHSELSSLRANAVLENGITVLSGTILHAAPQADYQLVIDWQDPNAQENPETIDLSTSQAGVTFDPHSGRFTVEHQYLDDAPSVTASDLYEVEVRLFEHSQLRDVDTASVRVFNVAPVFDGLAITDVSENGTAVLSGRISDPGTVDTFELNIFWKAPYTVQNFQRVDLTVPSPGVTFDPVTRAFTVEHRYLDDDPSGAATGENNLVVIVGDDDNGFFVGRVTGSVSNVPPRLADVTATNTTEGGATTLSGRIVDPGTLDTFSLRVNWGDGSEETFTYSSGATQFSETHVYLDDPKGPLGDVVTIELTLSDDDLGQDSDTVTIEVTNVQPTLSSLAALPIRENGVTTLTGVITDPGRFDTHRLEIQWGDPRSPGDSQAIDLTAPTAGVTYNAETGEFAVEHQYLDDPLGTTLTAYDITVRVIDNDGDSSTATTMVEVQNVAPSLQGVYASDVFENGVTTLRGRISDPGSLDTFSLTVNWGDGAVQEFTTTPGAAGIDLLSPPQGVSYDPATREFAIEHRYLDDGLSPAPSDDYEVRLTLVDDDQDMVLDATVVTVTNLPPEIAPMPNVTINEGDAVAIFTPTLDHQIGAARVPGSFTDVGTLDTHTGTVDWGDGSPLDSLVIVGAAGSFEFRQQHTYADNGVYTVLVTVTDDDSGQDTESFTVTVNNVDPTLVVPVGLEVDEGAPVTLIDLGVMISDPGFDNLLNQGNLGNGGEFEETFTVTKIDWGDGLETTVIDVVNRTSGRPGEYTTADIMHDAHYYADNGHYTVTVTLSDDDGGYVQRAFCLTVNNVNPIMTLRQFSADLLEIYEGQTLNLSDFATFSDPGYSSTTAGTYETFHFEINWGHYEDAVNHPDFVNDPLVESFVVNELHVVNGAPNTETHGSVVIPPQDAKTYRDNDLDNRYTVTITLYDDDGGSDTKSFEVVVKNSDPAWRIFTGPGGESIPFDPMTPADAGVINGDGTLEIVLEFTDQGQDSFVIWVDWGDGSRTALGRPDIGDQDALDLFGTLDTDEVLHGSIANGERLTLRHKYGPDVVDPNNASSSLLISALVVDDDYSYATSNDLVVLSNPAFDFVSDPGMSGLATALATPAGITGVAVAIDTTPEVALLEIPPLEEAVLPPEQQVALTALLSGASQESSGGDQATVGEQYWVLIGRKPDGSEWIVVKLDERWMTNLPSLFEKLPDGHYQIFRVRSEDNWRRLALDFHLRDHKAIDISDDSDGGRDMPPPSIQQQPPPEEGLPEPADRADERPAPRAADGEAFAEQATQAPPEEFRVHNRRDHLLASAGLAAAACLNGAVWREEIGKTLANSAPQDWSYLHALRRRPR
ncbi:MAG: hypothetical protein KDA37_06550 [Planctomycetales bacterium]|nr:hypothetical protein [Planctomycetales bacterium]